MPTPLYSLVELMAAENLDAIRNRLLARLEGRGFPAVSEWVTKGGAEMGFVSMISQSIADLLAVDVPKIAAGGFTGKASGIWMDLLAETVFLLKRVPASKTSFNMELLVAVTVDTSYTWDVGDVEIVAKSGNRYRNTNAATGVPGSSGILHFEAEAEGSAYNDDPFGGVVLVTTFPGVTLVPARPSFSTVHHSGISTGQIVPNGDDPAWQSYQVRIDVSGDPGTARYSLAGTDGLFVSMGTLQRTNPVGFFGMTLFALPGSSTPSFLAGDIFAFTSPGTPELVQGRDAESDEDLAARCRGRWPSLSLNPTDGLFQLWALLAVPTARRIKVSPDLPSDPTAVPGRVSMTVADTRGPIDLSALAAITAYITPKISALDGFVARQAVKRTIVLSGSVLVTPNTLVSVQEAAEKAWTAYLGSLPIGSRVERASLVQVLMDAGAVDVSSLLLDGEDLEVILAPGEVPSTAALKDALEWIF